MYSSIDLWAYGVLFAVLVSYTVYSRFQISKLVSPRKELVQFRYSFIVFGILAAFVYLWSPYFSYSYSLPAAAEIDSLEKAARLIARQSEDLKEMAVGLNKLEHELSLLLVIFCMAVLPALYRFAKAIMPDDRSKFSLLDHRSDE